jgi:hypothetical protein
MQQAVRDSLIAFMAARPDARNPMIDHDLVKAIHQRVQAEAAGCSRVWSADRRLVRWGAVHFGLRPHGQFDPSGRLWQAVLDDLWTMP